MRGAWIIDPFCGDGGTLESFGWPLLGHGMTGIEIEGRGGAPSTENKRDA